MNRINPEVGTVYKNRNRYDYLCVSNCGNGDVIMERIKDGWTLTAHGVHQNADGTIEWCYSTGGHFVNRELA